MTFVVGDYRAIELIGSGGSAQVWRGEVVGSGAPVALKVFTADRLSAARREAALAAAVDHPHVIRVLDVVGDDERAVLVTELATGGDLAHLLERRGRLSAGEVLTVLLPLAAALATAHERQIVHGDLSARNVVFDRAGRPLLADLGAGRAAAEHGIVVAVTPQDAAPELARGGTPCAATDMFSLGSLALACLTGRHAWPADDLRDVLIQAAAGQWPDPTDAAGPPLLVSAVRGLLEHDAERRPGAASLVMDLRVAGRPEPVDLQLGGSAVDRGGVTTDVGGALILGGFEGMGRQPGPTVGRHGLPAEPPGAEIPLAPHADRLDPGRGDRARAVTMIRPGAVVPPVPASPPGLRRPRAVRAIVVGVVALVVAGLAGAGGLWWARSEGTDPVALGQLGSAAPSMSSQAAPAAPSSTASSAVRPPRSPQSGSPRGVPPTTAPSSTGVTSTPGESTAAQADPRTHGSPSRLPTPKSAATTAAATTTAATATTATTATATDFTVTVRALDDARATALVTRNAALLDSVYTSGSAARSADARMIASLISGHLRLSGAEHLVRSAKVVGTAPLRIEVDDSLPSYLVLGADGAIVGSTAARAVGSRVMELVMTPAGYRISAVGAA